MEFWGVEVKAGEPLYVSPESGELIHISQVALGEVKNVKSVNSVLVHLTIDDKKFAIGTLSAERNPQIMFDLVLEKEFTLSHDWKDGSVYFCGYTCEDGDDEVPDDTSDEDSSESEDEAIIEKGKPVADVQAAIPTESKAKVTVVDPKKEESDDSEGSDEDDDESDDDDSDDDSNDDTSEDEETPKKVESSKKRPSSSEIKTPASTKKSKTETPQKQDGKKGSAHTATPHPAKKSEKKTAETPKSSAQVSCKSCSKKFNSEKGLESHSKSKHGGK